MSRGGTRKSWKNIFYSKWFLCLNCVVLVLITYASVRNFYYDYQVQKEIKKFQQQAENLKAKNIQTLEVLKHVKSQNFVEEKARTELNLVKPGENVLVVREEGGGETHRQDYDKVLKVEEEKNVSNPVKWWRYFFSN
jgi:cell division protein FtsB